jgi:hypothetical protein
MVSHVVHPWQATGERFVLSLRGPIAHLVA